MSMYGSIHTHFESQYDTGNDKEQMIKNFIANGAKRVAVTEHGVFSSYEDLRDIVTHIKEDALKEKKEDPNVEVPDFDIIPGVEGYFEDEASHIILIAKDYEGYHSLCKIISESNKNIIKGKPIITLDNLKQNVAKGHLICTSACIAGPFGRLFGLEEINARRKVEELDKELEESGYRNLITLVDEYESRKAYAKSISPTKANLTVAEREAKKTGDDTYLRELQDKKREAEFIIETLAKVEPQYKENVSQIKKMGKAKWARKLSSYEKYTEELKEIKEQISSGEISFKAQELLNNFIDVFGEKDFYFELQNHGLEEEKEIYNNIISFAYQSGYPNFIASNDIHVGVRKDDPNYEDMLKRRNVIKYTRFNTYQEESTDDREYTIKNNEELREELLKVIHDIEAPTGHITAEEIVDNAIGNIKETLKECSIEFPQNENHYPKFCDDENAEFEKLVREGIKRKFPDGFPQGKEKEYEERLEYELSVIKNMGYSGYHLIVADYLKYGRLLGYLPTAEEVANAPLSIKELDDYIIEKNYPRIGYSIGPGRGCSKKGGMVYTEFGAKPIEEIKCGDKVYDYTGKLCPVLKRWEYPVEEELLDITIWNGGKVSYTKDHKFYSSSYIPETNKMRLAQGYRYIDCGPELPFEWKEAEKLKQGDWLAIPRIKLPLANQKIVFDLADYASSKYEVTPFEISYRDTSNLIERKVNITAVAKALNMTKETVSNFYNNFGKSTPKTIEKITNYLNEHNISVDEWRALEQKISIPRFITLDSNLSYLIGYYIADGWCHNYTCHFAYNSETEQDYGKKIITLIRKVLGDNVTIKEISSNNKKCNTIHVYCAPFTALITKLVPGKAQTKRIPPQILKTSEEDIKALLLGLFDGDGSYCEGYRAKYSTCNKELAYEIKQILLHFGVASCVRSNKKKNPKWNDEWTVSFTTSKEARSIFPKLSESTRITNNIISYVDDEYIYMRIKEIKTSLYKGNVYDLAVDTNNEPSYCTEACAVHNSAVGSLCCYALDITDIDPIPYGLLFERFLNTERVSMPKQYWVFSVNAITQRCA